MPLESLNWMRRIKAVEREFGVVHFAVERLLLDVNNNPALLSTALNRPDITSARVRLEGTYIIRVFSEFETALQYYWQTVGKRKPNSAQALINRVRLRCHIPQAESDGVHSVRVYRNTLVHDRALPVSAMTIRQSTSALCRFLSRMQAIW